MKNNFNIYMKSKRYEISKLLWQENKLCRKLSPWRAYSYI